MAVFFPPYSSPVPMDHMVLFSGGWCPLLLFDCHPSSSSVFKALHNKSIWWRGVKCLAWLTLIKVISVTGFSPFLPRSWQIQNDLTFSIVILHEQTVVSQQGTRKQWNLFLDKGISCDAAPVNNGHEQSAVSILAPLTSTATAQCPVLLMAREHKAKQSQGLVMPQRDRVLGRAHCVSKPREPMLLHIWFHSSRDPQSSRNTGSAHGRTKFLLFSHYIFFM